MKAYRSMDRLQGERRFYPWMTVIAKRIVIDRHRKLSRVEPTDKVDAGSVEADLDHLFAAVDADHVRTALANVGPRHREVLVMREAQAMSYAEIADTLDVPMTTIEALLHRARKALRREYAAVTGEGSGRGEGLLGLPLVGWLVTRTQRFRDQFDSRWAEAGAVAAPIAAGAITAAIVLGPSEPAPEPTVEAAAPTTVVEAAPAPTPTTPFVVAADPGPVAVPTAPPATPVVTTTAPPPPPPALDAGPARVFVGPEGTDSAADEARDMPLAGDAGPVTGGADPSVVAEDLATFVADAAGLVAGPENKGVLP